MLLILDYNLNVSTLTIGFPNLYHTSFMPSLRNDLSTETALKTKFLVGCFFNIAVGSFFTYLHCRSLMREDEGGSIEASIVYMTWSIIGIGVAFIAYLGGYRKKNLKCVLAYLMYMYLNIVISFSRFYGPEGARRAYYEAIIFLWTFVLQVYIVIDGNRYKRWLWQQRTQVADAPPPEAQHVMSMVVPTVDEPPPAYFQSASPPTYEEAASA